jgi:hypothetical protein
LVALAPTAVGDAGRTVVSAREAATAVFRAQASLDDARGDLDAAVGSLTEIRGESVMANAGLVALLLRVVTARRHLEALLPAPDAS